MPDKKLAGWCYADSISMLAMSCAQTSCICVEEFFRLGYMGPVWFTWNWRITQGDRNNERYSSLFAIKQSYFPPTVFNKKSMMWKKTNMKVVKKCSSSIEIHKVNRLKTLWSDGIVNCKTEMMHNNSLNIPCFPVLFSFRFSSKTCVNNREPEYFARKYDGWEWANAIVEC